MYSGPTVFSQVMALLPLRRFQTCVQRYQGDRKVLRFSCLDQFRVMAFAQLTYRESLRDIETCLRAMQHKLYHMGVRARVSRNTLAHANEVRDWRIYADFAGVLIQKARRLYADEDFGRELDDIVLYALDATTIDLCLSLFPWARFRQTKSAIKLHTLMDLRGSIPTFIHISEGRVSDVKVLRHLPPEPGAIYIMDRGYIHFERLYFLHSARAFFVVRAKKNLRFRRHRSRPVDRTTGLRADQIVTHNPLNSETCYPEPLRRVVYFDAQKSRHLVFLTNNFDLPAATIADLYKARWRIELFFKWIKQHLRIKAFYGTSENAVRTQIWIAIATYLLVAILKKELGLPQSLYAILQVLSLSVFEQVPLQQALTNYTFRDQDRLSSKQLLLFD